MLDFNVPTGWRKVIVDDIKASPKGSIVSGPFGSNIGKRFFVDKGIPVIRGNNLTLGGKKFVDNGFVFITPEKANELKNCIAIGGDIVFTAAGTLGQVGLIPENSHYPVYIISNKQLRLRCNSEIAYPEFLYYWFSQPKMREYIANQNTGASIPLITLGTLRNLPLLLPPLPTQRRIAEILSAYDELIEVNTRRMRILEGMAQSVYREWFGQVSAESLPEGWDVVNLADVVDVNPTSIKNGNEPQEINYVDIASVSTGQIDLIQPMQFSEAPGRARRIVQHGDVIWSTVRPNRKSYSLIINPPKNMIVSTGFAVLRAKNIPFSYLYQATTTDDFVDYLTNHATGSAYPAVNSSDFENAEIVLPPKELIVRFDEIVTPIFSLRENLMAKNANLRRTRDMLLPRLVGGEVAV